MTGVLTYAHSFYEDYETTYFDHEPWEEAVSYTHLTLPTILLV